MAVSDPRRKAARLAGWMHAGLAIVCVLALAMGWQMAGLAPPPVAAGFFLMLFWLGLPGLALGALAYTYSAASGDRVWVALTFVPALAIVSTMIVDSLALWATILGAYVAAVLWRLGRQLRGR